MSKSTAERISAVESAPTEVFTDLVRIAGLDPKTAFRFSNLDKVDFAGCDLRNFDFTGAAIENANFRHTRICGAVFDKSQTKLPALWDALDYNEFYETVVNPEQTKKKNGSTNPQNAPDAGQYEELEVSESAASQIDPHKADALFRACKRGHRHVLKKLLTQSKDEVNHIHSSGSTPLIAAVMEDRASIVSQLLAHPTTQINQQDLNGLTPLTAAILMGHLEMLQAVMDHPDVDVNLPAEHGDTPLREAVGAKNDLMVSLLIKHKDINLNAVSADGKTTLWVAVEDELELIATTLLEVPEVDVHQTVLNDLSAFQLACGLGYKRIVQSFLDRDDLDVNFQGPKEGLTALTMATLSGSKECVELILARPDLNINSTDKYHKTALDHAISENKSDIIELLQIRGALTGKFT